MGAGGSVPLAADGVNEAQVREALANKLEAVKVKAEDEVKVKLPETVPATLEECEAFPRPEDPEVEKVYESLVRVYEEAMEQFQVPILETPIRALPETLDQAVYQYERWPVMVDPSGQGTRFMRYQRGTFLLAQNPADMDQENLRRTLVSAVGNGTFMIMHYDDSETMDLDNLFEETHFPKHVIRKTDLFNEQVLKKLLRKDKGDPEIELFQAKDDFKMVFITRDPQLGKAFAAKYNLAVVQVLDPNADHSRKTKCRDAGEEEIASAFGARDTKRNSLKLVEAAFDDEWDVIQDQIDKGYSIESVDHHDHTAVSEAACQGNEEIVTKLLELGADPNTQNDTGRTAMYRAAYNGHPETIKILLQYGGDPRLTSQLEGPYDVAKDDETRAVLEEWDVQETDKILERRKAEEERRIEERLTTAAERDAYAREKIRQELVGMAMEGKKDELMERLQELADEALEHNERPRGSAEVRDERGNTLLLIACWKGHHELVEALLTKYQEFDPEFDKVERKVFYASIKGRDSKGWNAVSLAAFHGFKKIVSLLLEKGCDPYTKNSYQKNAFDLVADELDACRKVVVDKSEIRNVLLDWEKEQNPRQALEREKAAKKAEMGDLADKDIVPTVDGVDDPTQKKPAGGKNGAKKSKKGGAGPPKKKAAGKKKK